MEVVARFAELTSALNEDATSLLMGAKESLSPTTRRSAVRSVFAAVEGLVSGIKSMILHEFPRFRHHYSDAEAALLREEAYVLNNKGDAIVQTRFVRLEENLRFVWKMFVREWGIDPEIDFESEGWKAFCDSIRVRNRITHPRHVEDLSISDREFSQVEQGYQFAYGMTMRNIARALLAARHRDYERMEKSLHPRSLQWLDTLEQRGSSPVQRPLTSDECLQLKAIETECQVDLMLGLRASKVIGDTDGAFSLLQHGADYRQWRLKRRVPPS